MQNVSVVPTIWRPVNEQDGTAGSLSRRSTSLIVSLEAQYLSG